MQINNRAQSMINIMALILIVTLAVLCVRVFTAKEAGLKAGDSLVTERASYAYMTKSAQTDGTNRTLNTEYSMGQEGLEEGSANMISSIVANYRGFDTLGEILVLFAAASGVGLLMGMRKRKKYTGASTIAKTAVPLISLVVMIAGGVMILYGHLTPGGGFPGGAIVASGLILMMLVSEKVTSGPVLLVLESVAGLGILTVGLSGLFIKGAFLANVFGAGQLGGVISGGMVLVMNILIGIKVGSEITTISRYFVYGAKE